LPKVNIGILYLAKLLAIKENLDRQKSMAFDSANAACEVDY
jgi:hypothetical protein